MKKIFIGLMIVMAVFISAPTPARAITIAELQAMIASLTAQLNVLLAKQVSPQPVQATQIINPTATSTGLVSFVERPTLKLVYDRNKNESSLEATANIYVDAGANDLLINYMSVFIGSNEGKQVFTNKRSAEFVGVSNAQKESVPAVYGSSNDAWRVKAGTRAIFKVRLAESPQAMFAGTYIASFGQIGILNKVGEVVYGQLAYEDTKSLPVTIIGEKSPYISGSDFKGSNVMISGVRFAKGDKLYVNNIRKGVLTDVSKLNNDLINGAFPISWLDKSEKGGCALYGSIQIEDSKYGKSNNYYVSKGCDDVSIQPIIIKDVQYSPASPKVNDLITTYVTVSNDSSKNYDKPFKVVVQGTAVVVPSLGAGVKKVVTVPNAFTFSFPGTQTLNTVIVYPLESDPGSGMSGNVFTNTLTFTDQTAPSVQAAANQLTRANLNLSYDNSRNELALNADQQFSVMAGGDDVYVTGASIRINRIGGESVTPKSGWVPNGTSHNFSGQLNTVQRNFVDAYGNNMTGWLVKAGQKATFITKMSMNPQLMYSGIYTAEVVYAQIYSNGNYGSAVWKGDSMPSNSVTLVGEKNVVPTTQPSITITSPNGGNYYPNDGSPLKVTWSTNNVPSNFTFDVIRLRGYPNGGEIILSQNVVNDGSDVVSFKGVPAGAYTLEMKAYLNGVLVMDASDSYFKIINSVSSKPAINSISPTQGVSGTMIKVYGNGFTTESIVLIGDNVESLTPMDISAYGDWLTFPFPASALEKIPNANTFSVRISNVGNVSVDSGLASNSVTFYVVKPPIITPNLSISHLPISSTTISPGTTNVELMKIRLRLDNGTVGISGITPTNVIANGASNLTNIGLYLGNTKIGTPTFIHNLSNSYYNNATSYQIDLNSYVNLVAGQDVDLVVKGDVPQSAVGTIRMQLGGVGHDINNIKVNGVGTYSDTIQILTTPTATTTTPIIQPRPRVVSPQHSQAEQINSIANVIEAIRQMIKSL